MAVRAPWDGGFNPETGWPADDSTGIPWQNDTEIPGQFKGGGAGFGPGGFRGSPKLTAPASGPPPGVSLSNAGGGASAVPNPHGDGPADIFPPETRPIPNNKAVGPFTGGSATENVFPQQQQGWPGWGGILSRFGIPGAAIGAGLAGIHNENQSGNVPAHGTGPEPVMSPEEMYRRQHPDQFTPNFVRPEGQVTRTFPGWPTPPAPAPAPATATPMPARPITPTPSTAYPAAPAAAGPAATRQRPNLGTYGAPAAAVANSPFTTFDRPNMSPQNSAQGRQGAQQMGMLDLSRLFGGGQPAPAAAAPVAASRPAAAAPVDTTSNAPWGYGPIQQGNVWKPGGTRTPSGRRKSSSTS